MFDEDELLPISALQHLEFCPRRCALIHLEGIWAENAQTAEGRALHERVHQSPGENVDGVRVARGLRLCSRELGLFGVADVVEFHLLHSEKGTGTSPPSSDTPHPSVLGASPLFAGTALPGLPGRWQPFPVEYKRGRRKPEMSYLVQLCAQALCVEEMLRTAVPAGALYHAKSRRRQQVAFDAALRQRTQARARELHELIAAGRPPAPQHGPKCKFCSLAEKCVPKLLPSRSARDYLARTLESMLAEQE
jgi:CRISPR-associated exonuclease Cas4